MAIRGAINSFELANPLYKNASVSFYTVANGLKTATLATLYAGPTGTAQLGNPQKLNSKGQCKQPIYIEASVIGDITGISVPGHSTAIYSPPAATFRVEQSTGKLQYSYDGGVTWNDSGDTIFFNRGTWVTATLYHRNDTVVHSGYPYLALSEHTSSVFATDLAAGIWLLLVDSLRGYPVVTDYGAVGDPANDNAAFMLAEAANEFTYVPQGMTFNVDAGRSYWKFFGEGTVHEPGVTWDLSPTPQTDFGVLKRIKRYTYGNYEHAVAATINVGLELSPLQSRANTQVMGTSGTGLKGITERGSVALHISNYGFTQSQMTNTTYTANTVTDATAVTGVAALATAGKLKRGMIIDVGQAADRLSCTHTGTIQSWSGNTITVDAWYTDGSGTTGTPSASDVATVNPLTKVWGINLNVKSQNDQVSATGFELGLLSNNATQAAKMWGFDSVGLSSTYKVQANFIARGYSTHAYIAGTTWGENDYGFVAENPQQVGHLVRRIDGQTSTGDSFAVETGKTLNSATGLFTTGGVRRWTVDKGGLVCHDYCTTKLDTDTTAVSVGHVIQTEVNTIINVTANRAFVLPTAVGIGSRKYTLIAYEACTIAAPGAETLDGAAAAFSVGKRGEIKIASDGANWIVESVSGYAQFQTPTFAAGDFTGSGAMTVTVASAANVLTYEYKIVGKHMWVNFNITAVMGGVAGAYILIKIPTGKTASSAVTGYMHSNQNGTFAVGNSIVNNAVIGANIACSLVNAANWTVGGITTTVAGQINFPIN